ncbi:MAG: protein kinase [Hyphomicrobium sp.]|nr:protein kinase [Hyphomicrobium sp.]
MPQTASQPIAFSVGQCVVGTRTRSRLTLSKHIGRGGEGDVFAVAERPGYLAKIYRNSVDGVLAAKLDHLASRRIPALKAVSAWPEEPIAAPRGGIVGFLMPAVTDAKPLHELMSPKLRRTEFPAASFNLLVEVALSIAEALDAFHAQDLVVGDINGRNILVRQSGSVCFIDIDSIQVGDGRQFPCTVGMPEYTPPELQGLSFADHRRSKDSDLFGLPVLIFQLLAMGRHPFDGTRLAREKAIKRHVSAFAWAAPFRTRPLAPLGMKPEQVLDDRMARMFAAAFAVKARFTGRPTARDWADALADYQTHLNTCASNPQHQFPMSLRRCPWCDLELKGKTVGVRINHHPLHPLDAALRGYDAVASRPLRSVASSVCIWGVLSRSPAPCLAGPRRGRFDIDAEGVWTKSLAAECIIPERYRNADSHSFSHQ